MVYHYNTFFYNAVYKTIVIEYLKKIYDIFGFYKKKFQYIVLELRTFVLKNRASTFWYQCSLC